MEVLAVCKDSHAHCCIRVDVTTSYTHFIENTGSEYVIAKMRTQEFNHRFVVMENYDVKRAARKFLSNTYTPHSPAASALLRKITQEDTMSEAKTFRAPATNVGAKTLPNKTEPAKTAAKEKASDPKKAMAALKDAAKTAKTAKKEAKAKPKAAPAKTAKKEAPKAKAAPAKTAKKEAPKAKAKPKASAPANDDRTIKATSKANECREGSFCHAQVKALQSSTTVSQAQAKLDKSGANPGGRRIEVAWAVKNGYIKVIG